MMAFFQVTLAPFKKNVCQGPNGILNDIGADMIAQLRDMLDELESMDMDIGDLIVDDASVAFKPLRENLQYLRAALRKYILEQKRLMQDILPGIRAGNADMVDLVTRPGKCSLGLKPMHNAPAVN